MNYKNTKLVFVKDDFVEEPDKVMFNTTYTLSGDKTIKTVYQVYGIKTGKYRFIKETKKKWWQLPLRWFYYRLLRV